MKIAYDTLEDILIQIGDESGHDRDTVAERIAKILPSSAITSIDGVEFVVFDSPSNFALTMYNAIHKMQEA